MEADLLSFFLLWLLFETSETNQAAQANLPCHSGSKTPTHDKEKILSQLQISSAHH
jgi:hypothetical protein